MKKPPTLRSIIIVGGVAALIIVLLLLLLQSRPFRVVGATPGLTGSLPTATSIIEIEFNREIDKSIDYTNNLVEERSVVKAIEVDGSTMRVSLVLLDDGNRYIFSITDVRSTRGELIKSVDADFVATYVPHDELSKEQRALLLEETDRGNNEDPLTSYLPYEGDRFYLSGEYSSNELGEPIFVVDTQLFLTRADMASTSTRNQAIAEYQKRAEDFVASKGFDPSKYFFRFDIVEPPTRTE